MNLSKIISLVMATLFFISVSSFTNIEGFAYSSPSLELGEFRWSNFPIKVLVDMNNWSHPDYATSVHEALTTWMISIWTFSETYNATELLQITSDFYVSGVNSSANYDILVTFSPTEILPDSNTVGLTTYEWNPRTHQPLSPITINITTYSGTAKTAFIKNVAMHELGHAFGLKHAFNQQTSDGYELMYYQVAINQALYPSTLDLYGLNLLYQNVFGQTIQLPPLIPYTLVWPPTYGTITILHGLDNDTYTVEHLALLGEGVYPLGTVITVKVAESLLLNNQTRLSFNNWYLLETQTFIYDPMTSLLVYGNLTLRIDWILDYYVDVVPIWSKANFSSGYFPNGSLLTLDIAEKIHYFRNGTRMVYQEFFPNNFHVVEPSVCIALWDKQFSVNITSASNNPPSFDWQTQGEIITLSSPTFIIHQNWRTLLGIRDRFVGWVINEQLHSVAELPITINQPLVISAIWEPDYTYTAIILFFFGLIFFTVLITRQLRTNN